MLPPVLFPDVEDVTVSYLLAALASRDEPYAAGVEVSNTLRSPRPPRAVTVRSDGGPRANAVQSVARIGINVWARTDKESMDLARLIGGLLGLLVEAPEVNAVSSVSTPIRIQDAQPRTFLTAELLLRAVPLT